MRRSLKKVMTGLLGSTTFISIVVFEECDFICKARFKRRILHAPNAIQTMHNEEAYLIIYCLNCIRCMQNSTFETGLMYISPFLLGCLKFMIMQ